MHPSRTRRLVTPLRPVGSAVRRWAVDRVGEVQLRSRRNAMVAATEAARRRIERDDVAEFLAGRAASTHTPTHAPTHTSTHTSTHEPADAAREAGPGRAGHG